MMVVPNMICHGGSLSEIHEFSLKSFLKISHPVANNVIEMEESYCVFFCFFSCKGHMFEAHAVSLK